MEDTPFPNLSIASFDFLRGLETREKCPLCGRSRMFYCYNCFVALPSLVGQLPRVKLPYKVHVIKHPGERCGKSTAVHAAVLDPEDVTIFTYPDIPVYDDTARVVLVFPGENSVTLSDYLQALKTARLSSCLAAQNTLNSTSTVCPDVSTDNCEKQRTQNCKPKYKDLCHSTHGTQNTRTISNGSVKDSMDDSFPNLLCEKELGNTDAGRSEVSGSITPQPNDQLIDIVVFIDSTWFQVHKISIDPRLSVLQRIELTTHETKFWRPQLDKPSTYLSTIEAIYYCACEYHNNSSELPYDGQYDNLLFFFCYFYQKIKTLTSKTGKKLKAYHERRKKPKIN